MATAAVSIQLTATGPDSSHRTLILNSDALMMLEDLLVTLGMSAAWMDGPPGHAVRPAEALANAGAIREAHDDIRILFIQDDEFQGGFRKSFVLPESEKYLEGRPLHEVSDTAKWLTGFVELCEQRTGFTVQ